MVARWAGLTGEEHDKRNAVYWAIIMQSAEAEDILWVLEAPSGAEK